MKKRINWMIFSISMIFVTLSIGGCGIDHVISDVKDQVTSVAQMDEQHVQMVKNSTMEAYPDKKIGKYFDKFFGNPTWKYFKGTTEDSDEEQDVVEFSGSCMYDNVKVKARIQFTLDDNNSFEATYLSFNEVPQNRLILGALMMKVFEDEGDYSGSQDYSESDYGYSESDYGYGESDYGYSESDYGYGESDYDYGDYEGDPGDTDYSYLCEAACYYEIDSSDVKSAMENSGGYLPGGRSIEQMIINEIYARHGYIFKADELNDYFYYKSWYTPMTSDMNEINADLSDVERTNIDYLKSR